MSESKLAPAGGRGAVLGSINAFRKQGIPFKLLESFAHANKQTGFDCPGCAFPDKPGTPMLDSCEQGQKAIAWEMTRKAVGAEFFAGKSLAQLQALSDLELEQSGRLTTPMVHYRAADGDAYQAISWERVFDLLARTLKPIDPHAVAFYASGRSSNEAAFLWQLVARAYGSPNLPDSSNFCHEPSGLALKEAIGTGKGTCSLQDFEHAELFIVMGQNPASNHPRMMAALYEARRRGAKIIALNPLRERGFTAFSDPKNVSEMLTGTGIEVANAIYQVQIGGDFAALSGVIKALFELEAARPGRILDQEFIDEHTLGLDALRAQIDGYRWPELEAAAGLSAAQMREIAGAYSQSNATMITWCMGITHHKYAVDTIQQIVNLLLLRGNIGKAGAGAMPVRGHSNVQGDRTMGASSQVSGAWLDNLQATFPGLEIERAAGLDAAAVIDGLFAARIKAVLSLGGNFGVAAPDSPRVLAALAQTELTVHIATKLNRSHCYPGQIGLILPTLGRTDVDIGEQRANRVISTEDSMSTIRSSRGLQNPISAQQWAEPQIVAHLGQHLARAPNELDWLALASDYDRIRDAIEACQKGVTAGFEDFSKRLATQLRFHLPNAAAARVWNTASKRAQFTHSLTPLSNPLQRAKARFGPDVLILMTIRSHDQFNTTVYSNDDRYRGIQGNRHVLFMSTADLRARALKNGASIAIETASTDGQIRCLSGFTVVEFDIPEGAVAAYFPEATPLIPAEDYSLRSNTPLYKEIPVWVRPF